MVTRKISHARGKGSLNHNNRNHIYKNVDPAKTENNIYYAKESLEVAYQKCFGEALEKYNAKQKRSDRKIDNYYNHLFGNANKDTVATSTNKEKSFYEIVIGIGDKNTCAVGSSDGELATKILDEYAKGFSERNPNFYVFNSVMHLDEKTPHLHIDYIPIAHGYKKGMETRNSQSVALEQMGFGKNKNSINEWRIQERQILRELCQVHGLEIAEETQGRGKTFTPDEYKKLRDEAKEELKTAPELLDELKEEIRVDVEVELLSEQQYLVDEIVKHKQKANSLANEILNRKQKANSLANEIVNRKQEESSLISEIVNRKQEVNNLQNEKATLQNELDKVEGKRMTLETIKEYTATPSKLNKDNVIIPLTQYNNLKKTAIEGSQNLQQQKDLREQQKDLRERKKTLDSREQALNNRESELNIKENNLNNKESDMNANMDAKLKKATNEVAMYRQRYNNKYNEAFMLNSELVKQKSETKRWEDNYNNLYRQHVQVKRSKGLER